MGKFMEAARALPAEDLHPRDFVLVMHVLEEIFPLWDCDAVYKPKPEMIRWWKLPDEGEQKIYRIVEVCLPFVLVQDAKGERAMLDVRKHRLARVSPRFGKGAFAKVAEEKSKKNRTK